VAYDAVLPANWTLYQPLLCQCIVAEPGTLPKALSEISAYVEAGYPLAGIAVGDALNNVIAQHSKLGHGSEVAWALWGLAALGLPVGLEATKQVSGIDDSLCALLALYARAEGLVTGQLDTAAWEAELTVDGLYDKHWMLSYEAQVKGWLQAPRGADPIGQDQAFDFLRSHRVAFFDTTRVRPMTIPAAEPILGGPFSLELA